MIMKKPWLIILIVLMLAFATFYFTNNSLSANQKRIKKYFEDGAKPVERKGNKLVDPDGNSHFGDPIIYKKNGMAMVMSRTGGEIEIAYGVKTTGAPTFSVSDLKLHATKGEYSKG